MKHWPKARPEDVQAMLGRRLRDQDVGVEWLDGEIAEEVLEQQDAADVQQLATKKKQTMGDKAALRDHTAKLKPSEPASKKARQGLVAEGTRAYPRRIDKPEGAVTEGMARQWLPVGFRLYCDELSQRWLLSCEFGHRSFSFGKWGYNRAVRQLVEAAWALHKEHGGGAMPFELPAW